MLIFSLLLFDISRNLLLLFFKKIHLHGSIKNKYVDSDI